MSDTKRVSKTRQIGVLLGQNIAAARRKQALTQQELAERVRIESVTVSRLETGASLLSVVRLIEIAGVLGISLAELLGGVSPHATDQAEKMLHCLQRVSEADRYLLVNVVKCLAERLAQPV